MKNINSLVFFLLGLCCIGIVFMQFQMTQLLDQIRESGVRAEGHMQAIKYEIASVKRDIFLKYEKEKQQESLDQIGKEIQQDLEYIRDSIPAESSIIKDAKEELFLHGGRMGR